MAEEEDTVHRSTALNELYDASQDAFNELAFAVAAMLALIGKVRLHTGEFYGNIDRQVQTVAALQLAIISLVARLDELKIEYGHLFEPIVDTTANGEAE